MKMERRKFINILLGAGVLGWLGSIFHPLNSFLLPPKVPEANVNSVKAGKVDDFEPNSGQIVKFGRKPVILIRTDNGDFYNFTLHPSHFCSATGNACSGFFASVSAPEKGAALYPFAGQSLVGI